ncbi:response regulator [Cesiribacter sp. SM1]|uniref:response regulator n=1 Tax=Cesiribacter sp. SM1 TaxID=2861196 RepID=UPI001CD6938D|nr:response regulator [Cesiribacter sp. SM1]
MAKLSSILLVDDDAAANFINQLLLRDMVDPGNLLIAQNGEEALSLLVGMIRNNTSLPALILLDLNMPVMDGFEFLEAYKELDLNGMPRPLIAVLTTSMNPRDVKRVQDLGIFDFINKPLSPKTVTQLIEKSLVKS